MKHPGDGQYVVVQGAERLTDLHPTEQQAIQEADRLRRERKVQEAAGAPPAPPVEVKQNLFG
jgi:hypothetical protein